MTEVNYQKGLEAIEDLRFEDAVIHFTNSLNVERSSGAFHNRAYSYMNLGELDSAKIDYQSAIEIVSNRLNRAKKNDKEHINLCLRDIIDAKATVAHIEMQKGNFLIAENMYTELMNVYMAMPDNIILRADLHISNFYSNRGMARLNLNRTDDAARDIGAAFVETTSEKTKLEILEFAEMIGLLEKIKENIIVYSFLKSAKDDQKALLNFELDFVFNSSDHVRYENGKHISGPHGGARRAVKVEPNVNGDEGYTVTLYNLEGNHPLWQNNIQMAPKQMKVIQAENNKIVLKGYGFDSLGSSFADYGLTIKMEERKVVGCILHLLDRGVDIEYLQ